MQYLFLATLGPVQGFIASARRTRDLWFGSQLLSDLSWTAAAFIARNYGPDTLIFPAFGAADIDALRAERNVANKIVAILEPLPDAQTFAVALKNEVIGRLMAIKDQLYADLDKQGAPFNRDTMDKQLEDLIEFYWVAQPFPYRGNSNYAQIRQLLEAQIAARKATYTYQAVTWGSAAHKSSIGGALESVIPLGSYASPQDANADKQKAIEKLYAYFHAGPAEHLSGVDLLKRRGHFPDTVRPHEFFLSTSHVAAQPYLTRLEALPVADRNKLRDVWILYSSYLDHFVPSLGHERIPDSPLLADHPILGRDDGALLFEEHLAEHAASSKEIFQRAQVLLKDFYKEVDKVYYPQKLVIDPYYAIIMADGDSMGVTIDALAKEDEGKKGPEQHQAFSRQLALFAGQAKKIIYEHQGTPIYAGGDDVLALVPLHQLLDCTTELATTFTKTLNDGLQDIECVRDAIPTLSMGVAIVHHLTLLQESLEIARRTEKIAKKVKGKKALAICLSKRGGEQSLVKAPRADLTGFLLQLIDYYRRDVIPHGLPYELRSMYQHLIPIAQDVSEDLNAVIWSSAKRILQRKLELPGSKVRQASPEDVEKQAPEEEAKKILITLLGRIEGRPQNDPLFREALSEGTSTMVPLPEFINELLIARELAEATQLAYGAPNPSVSLAVAEGLM